MRFYSKQHKYYCGVDLHAKTMYVCIIDQEARIIKQKNIKSNPASFLKAIDKCRDDIVVSAECIFTWYWLADLCSKENIAFILGHALYMKAIHGGKAKNDRIDAYKIAYLLRGGNIPVAYVYPNHMRATRDLMRRRNHIVRKRAELLGHIQNTNHQYNLPPLPKNIRFKGNREGLIEHFSDESNIWNTQQGIVRNQHVLRSHVDELRQFVHVWPDRVGDLARNTAPSRGKGCHRIIEACDMPQPRVVTECCQAVAA